MIRVVLADDHVLLLDGLVQALSRLPDIEVVGTATDGAGVVELVGRCRPDVLLIDLEMPVLDGLEALAQLDPCPPAIVVSMHADPAHRRRAFAAGAVGFLSKATPLPELAAAVRAAAAGELLEEDGLATVLERYREPTMDPGAASLTRRERQVLALLASGVSSSKELALRLYISEKTVKNHLASIYDKLAISDRAQAAVEAIRLGLVRK